jgi:hypothetical protein
MKRAVDIPQRSFDVDLVWRKELEVALLYCLDKRNDDLRCELLVCLSWVVRQVIDYLVDEFADLVLRTSDDDLRMLLD